RPASGVPVRIGRGRAETPLLDRVRTGIENDFEQVVFPQYPELREMKRVLEREGAQYASLSGSGSAIYGLFASRAAAEKAVATLVTATEKKVQAGVDEKPERKPQRARVDDKFKIFCGTANEALADEVCAFLGLHRGQAMVTRFKDGEAYVQIQENVRGADVFVIQPTCRRVDEHLMELLLMIDALKRASARRI